MLDIICSHMINDKDNVQAFTHCTICKRLCVISGGGDKDKNDKIKYIPVGEIYLAGPYTSSQGCASVQECSGMFRKCLGMFENFQNNSSTNFCSCVDCVSSNVLLCT